ncbi:MAG: hypothetical protein QOI10_174 [Solirubrobacterales bacterium]|jgi:hypothetical protein|nr:hypothetical protein [Solirubrobacterales bacterium]
MTRSRYVWVAVAVVLACAVVAGGYALGAAQATDDQEARSASLAAAGPAAAVARAEGLARGVGHGFAAGTSSGRRRGQRQGAARGTADGQVAANKAFNATAVARAGRAEREPLPGSGLTGLPGSGGVLVVGDSLEVLTSPYLKNYLPPDKLTVNAVGGYSSLQIFQLFQESYDPSQSVIVFDAGTNDNPSYPEILAGRLQAVARIVGDRCMVVPTIHGLNVDGVTSAGKNRVVAAFAASRPATVTPDWAGFVATHPQLMQPDHLHPTPEGADARAQLIAQGVEACQGGLGLGPSTTPPGD